MTTNATTNTPTTLRLHYTPMSPFARKAIIVADGNQVPLDLIYTHPLQTPEIRSINPLGKIPALETPDHGILYDSPVICEYLDCHHLFFPTDPAEKWPALRLQALADGIMDAAVLIRMEQLRPDHLQSNDWIAHQQKAINNGLIQAEEEILQTPDSFKIGHVATVCALGYLNFRQPHLSWQDQHPDLAQWFTALSERPIIANTIPVG